MSTDEQADVVRLDINRHGITVGRLVIVIGTEVVTFTIADGDRLAVVERDELRQWFLRPERPITKGRLSFEVAGRYLEGISIDRGEQIIVPPFLSAMLASSADRLRVHSH